MTSIPKDCKRLAEVDFPIGKVSIFSAEEKKVFGSHPSMLNQWWARRPLGACRSVLLTLLLPDPTDPRCPKEFKVKARNAFPKTLVEIGPTDEDLKKGILDFIGDFSSWDKSSAPPFVATAISLVKAAYGDETPLVVDPFAGGGQHPIGGTPPRSRMLCE